MGDEENGPAHAAPNREIWSPDGPNNRSPSRANKLKAKKEAKLAEAKIFISNNFNVKELQPITSKETERLARSLSRFFRCRQYSYDHAVKYYFRYHEFPDLAKGIFNRYKCLPIGWKEYLKNELRHGNTRFKWLKPYYKDNLFIDMNSEKFPPIGRIFRFPERDPINRVVDELIEGERLFLDQLSVILDVYVLQIEAMADQKTLGVGPSKALGLTQSQVEYIFGKKFKTLHKTVQRFWVYLEVIVLVPEETSNDTGRIGYFIDLMFKYGDSILEAYLPYCARYGCAFELWKTKAQAIKRRSKRNTHYFKNLSFVEFWDEIAKSYPVLKGTSFELVMSKANKRFLSYNLYLETIEKKLRKSGMDNTPIHKRVLEGQVRVKELSTRINNHMTKASHEEAKLLKKFMLE